MHRVAAWFSSQGLTVSPGTLADSLKRFVPLFEPVAHAILAHQNKAALRHADETGWRVQELRGEERSSRAWLWTSVSGDAVCFHIDPSRSAEAAQKLFGEALLGTVIVCDRYSAYKRLVRLLGGLVILAFCWSHVRRDFIVCAAGQVDLTDWCRGWIERIAGIYRLNEARLEHYDSGLKRPAPAFDATQTALKEALDALFAEAQRELAALPDEARGGQGATLAPQPSRRAERLRRPAPGPDGQQSRRARAPGAGHRKTIKLRFEQRGRRQVHGDRVLRGRHALDERHRCAALAGSVARCLCKERPPTARRPVALAAVVHEREAQARVHGAGMTGMIECRYYGRDFTADEMALLRALIAADPQPTRAALSREFCRRIGWFKPDGGLKDMMAMLAMLAMHRDGVIALPPPKGRQYRPKPIVFGPETEPPLFPPPTTLDEVRTLEMRTVVRGTREGRLWNEFVARYHYLGYRTLVGAQMRYAVHDRNGWPHRHARLLHRRLEARPARQLHRMDAATA